MNKRGAVPMLVLFALGVAMMFFASNQHAKQRLEKQKTEAGRIEYPLEQNYPDHSYKPFQGN